jgi:hypothetical protein
VQIKPATPLAPNRRTSPVPDIEDDLSRMVQSILEKKSFARHPPWFWNGDTAAVVQLAFFFPLPID